MIFADASSVDCRLKIYTRMSSGEKAYGCEPCETFIHVNHLRIQTEEKLFKCKICGKTFNLVSRVNRHIRKMHTEKRPYECDIFDKTFIRNCDLNRHLKIHTEEELCDCDRCGKIFTENASLNHHLKIHTSEKPYKCDTCG